MCAQFEIEKTMLVEKLKKLKINFEDFNFKPRILPHSPAPILVQKDNQLKIEAMNFSLIPWWSKDKKPKFATHNARLESIKDKPTWKNIFGKKHCLTPVTSFIEPIYEGEYAGHMLQFNLSECLFVPSLFDVWHDKATGEIIESFAIITSDPPKYVAEIGHDRSPIFIKQEDVLLWMDTKNKTDNFFFDLLNKKITPEISVKIDRKLKPGWEKRAQ